MSTYRRYNYRAYPTQGQCEALSRLFGVCRYVYNWVIDQRELMHVRHGVLQSKFQLDHMLTELKKDPDHKWLADVASSPLGYEIRHADLAYQNFYRLYKAGKTHIVINSRTGKKYRTGFPRYKSRRGGEQSATFSHISLSHPLGCKWAFLNLTKVGHIKLRWTRDLPEFPSSVTIMKHADGTYEVSFVVPMEDDDIPPAPNPIHDACGIDMGLDSLMSIVYSDGSREKISHPRTLKHYERRIRKLDKKLARQQKGSKNYEKTRLLKAKTYHRIQNQRKDMAYKLASRLVGENQAIAMETLNVSGLAQTRLAKSLLDANWTRIINRIRELSAQYNRDFRQIDRWY